MGSLYQTEIRERGNLGPKAVRALTEGQRIGPGGFQLSPVLEARLSIRWEGQKPISWQSERALSLRHGLGACELCAVGGSGFHRLTWLPSYCCANVPS